MDELISENKQTRSWERKRTCTIIVFTLQYFIFGAEMTGNAATLWIYITTLINTDSPALLYGLINASIFVPPILFSTVISRQIDKMRRVRLCLIIANFLSMIGSVLYVTSSPCLVSTGNFLQGCAFAFRPLMVGEIVRSYHSNELQQKLPILSCAEAFGNAAGPVIMIMFLHTDFRIFDIHVTYANVSGLVFLSLDIIIQVLVVLMVSDLSREFDLKQHYEYIIVNEFNTEENINEENKEEDVNEENTEENVNEENTEENVNEDNTEENVRSLKDVLKNIVTNIDPLFVMIYSFFRSTFIAATYRMLPIIIMRNFHYKNIMVTACYVVNAITTGTLTLILTFFKATGRQVYLCGVVALLTLLVNAGFLFTFSFGINNTYITSPMLIVYAVLLSIHTIGEIIFAQVVCAKLTKSQNQSFVEGIRLFVMSLGYLSGALIPAYACNNLVYFSIIMSVITIILLSIAFSRRAHLPYPSPII